MTVAMLLSIAHLVGCLRCLLCAFAKLAQCPSCTSQSACFLICTQSNNRAFASADGDEDDDEQPPPSKHAVPARPSAAVAGRGAGRAGPGAAAGKGPKDAAARQAEFRAKKLEEEQEVGRLLA